ncbi:MAG: hypothetical protein AAF791_11000 [Bacteroidota bacterium]
MASGFSLAARLPTDVPRHLKARSLAIALFVAASLLWGVALAVLLQDIGFALAPTAYAAVASALVAAVLAPRLRQRAETKEEVAGGIFDGAGLMTGAYVLGVVLMAFHNGFLTAHSDFLGITAVGLIMGAFLLPPALIFGGLAGLVFRTAVVRGAV